MGAECWVLGKGVCERCFPVGFVVGCAESVVDSLSGVGRCVATAVVSEQVVSEQEVPAFGQDGYRLTDIDG